MRVDGSIHTLLYKLPSNIIFVGGSAGGTLVMSVLSHILNPQHNLNPLILTAALKSAADFSLWINLYMESGSAFKNQMGNSITAKVMRDGDPTT